MVTQKQIAEELNLSQATVANILRGSKGPKYSEKTQLAVRDAVARLGYQPNRSAQAIQRGRSNLIGIIHFGGMLGVSHKVSDCLPQIVAETGYDYLVIELRWHGGKIDRVIDEIIKARVEGVIVTHMVEAFGPQYTARLAKAGIPIVALFGNPLLNIPIVSDDAQCGFNKLTKHLLSIGHRDLLLMVGGSDARPMQERIAGFREGMDGVGSVTEFQEDEFFSTMQQRIPENENKEIAMRGTILRINNKRYDDNMLIASYEICKKIFSGGAMPHAILCSNDKTAFGAYNAAHEAGIRIPHDIALTGCDDDDFGPLPMFKLTTLRKDVQRSCEAVVAMLVKQMRDGEAPGSNLVFQSTLVLRASCGQRGEPRDIPL